MLAGGHGSTFSSSSTGTGRSEIRYDVSICNMLIGVIRPTLARLAGGDRCEGGALGNKLDPELALVGQGYEAVAAQQLIVMNEANAMVAGRLECLHAFAPKALRTKQSVQCRGLIDSELTLSDSGKSNHNQYDSSVCSPSRPSFLT
jgi:hypothetical protein